MRSRPSLGWWGSGPVLQVVAADIFFLPGEVGHFVVEITLSREAAGGEEKTGPLGLWSRGMRLPGGKTSGPYGVSRAPG